MDAETDTPVDEGGAFRRCECQRAFRDRAGGWTIVTRSGTCRQLRTPASLILWEALEEGDSFSGLLERLAARFPDTERSRLALDLAVFLASLRASGLVRQLPASGGLRGGGSRAKDMLSSSVPMRIRTSDHWGSRHASQGKSPTRLR